MERTRTVAIVLAAVALVLVMVGPALSQATLPAENHYKVYNSTPITKVKPVELIDQFGPLHNDVWVFDKFATPADKILPDGTIFPMVNPDIHQSWWRFRVPQPSREVIGIDQFGTNHWTLGDAVYLLLPAKKNVLPPIGNPPVWNHYLCYEAYGPTLFRPVTLVDQFGTAQVVILQGKYFCNPVEKIADGIIYPILDQQAHLTCYQVQNPLPTYYPISVLDQFGYWQTQILDNDCLCLPALKEFPIGVERTTWGKIKSLYHD